MFNSSLRHSILLVPLLAFAGCGGGAQEAIDDAMKGLPPQPVVTAPPQDVVAGPVLSGTWASECSPILNGSRFAKLTYKFNGKNVVRSEDIFDGAECDRVVDYKTNGGGFIYTAKFANDVYEVEYNLASSAGFVKHRENIQVFSSEILVTYGSHGSGIAPDISLHRTDKPANPTAEIL